MKGFHGQPTRNVSPWFMDLEGSDCAGSRIVRPHFRHLSNLHADVPDSAIAADFGDCRTQGGHRLWDAPDGMPHRYSRDDAGNSIDEIPDGLHAAHGRNVL
jgi:hypothetical protein